MSWKIVLKSETVEYRVDGEPYYTHAIKLVSADFHNEPGGYKEPEDTVCVAIYEADSGHGKFTWKVSARRSGFETYATIEDVFETTIPDPSSIDVDEPSFDIEGDEE